MPCWIQIAICWCRGYTHLLVQFIRNKDRLFPEGRSAEKFGPACCRRGEISRLKNALWVYSAPFFVFLLVRACVCVCFFSIFPWMQAKCGGSHGDISIAATELCSLFTIWCKIVNVRFNCLLFSASCHVVPWISILICVRNLEKCGENSSTLNCNKDKKLNTLSLTSTGKNIRTENNMPKFYQSPLN